MPYCENQICQKQVKPNELIEDDDILVCIECHNRPELHPVVDPGKNKVLGREFDYGVSYNRRDGFKAHARLGGARLSFEVDQDELRRTFGPEDS